LPCSLDEEDPVADALPARPRTPRAVALVAAALLLVAALIVAGARAAVSAAPLPEVPAEELLASVARAAEDPPPVSGEIASSIELGLPDLGAMAGAGASEGLAAVTGDRRLRLWRSEEGLRVAQLTDTAERAFVTNGEEAWLWDSAEASAERIEVPERFSRRAGDAGGDTFDPTAMDPVALAGEALAAADATTEVSVEANGRVAGRDTYRLVVVPRTDQTLVGRVEIDIDAAERLPLHTAVFARDAEAPSVEVAFTRVSFDPIDRGTYDFTPPPGTDVTEHRAGDARHGHRGGDAGGPPAAAVPGLLELERSHPDVRTFGEGWASVVAFPRPPAAAAPEAGAGGDAAALLDQALPFSGPLFSARSVTVDGREWILAGAVGQDTLERAAAALR
jgi:hypothetical protein